MSQDPPHRIRTVTVNRARFTCRTTPLTGKALKESLEYRREREDRSVAMQHRNIRENTPPDPEIAFWEHDPDDALNPMPVENPDTDTRSPDPEVAFWQGHEPA